MRGLEPGDELVDVVRRDGRVAEVAKADVLGLDVLVQATGDDNVAGPEGADERGGRDAVRDVDGGHAVRGRARVGRDVLEAEREGSRLEFGALVAVGLEALLERDGAFGNDLERRLKRVDEVLGSKDEL